MNSGPAGSQAVNSGPAGSTPRNGMPTERRAGGRRPLPDTFQAALVAGIVVLDQLTKFVVRLHIPMHDSVTIVPGALNLVHVRNTGAAFGFLNAVEFPHKATVVALVATAALIGIALYAARVSSHERLARAGLALVLGGALGNLIDRLTIGSVVDFIDVVFGNWHFWAFNVADSAITLGVAAMLADMIGLDRHVPPTP